MQINADLTKRALVLPSEGEWVGSPLPGVERYMLDRDGGEVARATSLVRYAPNSRFDAHTHGGGEEFLVLEGVFSDQSGSFSAGSYVRNPIGSSHAPWSEEGCTILVKLHQFQSDDAERVVVRTQAIDEQGWEEFGKDVTRIALHQHGLEEVWLVRMAPGSRIEDHFHDLGEEIFVVDGTFTDEYGTYPKWSWVRYPHGSSHSAWTAEGCTLFLKAGHLPGA